MALSLHVAVWHHFLFLISSDKLQDGASMHELAEAVNLLFLQDTNLDISVNLRSIIVIKVS